MKIYIAGPYTHPDPAENTRKAILAGEEIIRLGHIPFIPHLAHLWHLISPHEPDFWYTYGLKWLSLCDALLRLPGESVGADREVRFATKIGLTIYHNINSISTSFVMKSGREFNLEEPWEKLFSTKFDEWKQIKQSGESHHKTGGVEPIDLYKSGGILKSFAIGSIIKYAFRNRNRPIVEKDLDKIIHYAQILRVLSHEEEIIK